MNYTISNGSISVGISSAGGSLISIKDADGTERLWQPDPSVWAGQAPICFPICGGLRDGQATALSGWQVSLPRHGFARKREFTLKELTPTHASLVLRSDAETLAAYPFPFRFVASYDLRGRTLQVSYATTNTGDEPMPFFVGGHPAFRAPVFEGERYEDYRVVFEKNEPHSVPTPEVSTGLIDVERRQKAPQQGRVLPITHRLFQVAETIYDKLESRSVALQNADGSHGVRLSFPDMPYLVVWSKPNGDFVAVEPWSGLSTCSDEDDVLEHKRGCLIAQPGQTVKRGFSIEVF